MCEAFLPGGRSHGHAVEQDLMPGRTEQHAAPSAVLQRLAQFLPSRVKLRRGLGVAKLIQPRKLQQNVQTADKRARSGLRFTAHSGVSSRSNGHVLVLSTYPGGTQSTLVSPCPRHKPHRTPCTHLNNRFCCPFGNISLTRGRCGSSGLFSGRQVPSVQAFPRASTNKKGRPNWPSPFDTSRRDSEEVRSGRVVRTPFAAGRTLDP